MEFSTEKNRTENCYRTISAQCRPQKQPQKTHFEHRQFSRLSIHSFCEFDTELPSGLKMQEEKKQQQQRQPNQTNTWPLEMI